MDAKLTLKLDKKTIEKAKKYASMHQKSLSRIIESYLQSLLEETRDTEKEKIEISPFVKSMSQGKSLPLDIDYKKEYAEYLTEKHK
jgi:hypothetical protein